jgi:anthranilate synthase component 1
LSSNGTLSATFPVGPGEPEQTDEERIRAPSLLDAVRHLVGLVEDVTGDLSPPPGVYGAFSYDLVDRWENLPRRRPDVFQEPDLNLVLALDTVVFDHMRGEVCVINRFLDANDEAEADARHRRTIATLQDGSLSTMQTRPGKSKVVEKDVETDVSDEDFMESVRKFLRHIHAGDIFQSVLSRGLTMNSGAATLDVYRMLRENNPSPYMFHLDVGDGVLMGASPETCVKVEEGHLEIRPIAGTAPRGCRTDGTLDPDLDGRLSIGLLLDDKEQAEHVMLVDLARNDVARVSVPGTREVTDPFSVEKYSHVQHLVSRVRGTLLPDLDALHAYRASANMGTLTGAPKLRAMELIRENEPHARGFYGGAVGYLLRDGSFDSCIVIRSMRYRDGIYFTRAGAGIVADSDPQRELDETTHKARACRLAVAGAERVGR